MSTKDSFDIYHRCNVKGCKTPTITHWHDTKELPDDAGLPREFDWWMLIMPVCIIIGWVAYFRAYHS